MQENPVRNSEQLGRGLKREPTEVKYEYIAYKSQRNKHNIVSATPPQNVHQLKPVTGQKPKTSPKLSSAHKPQPKPPKLKPKPLPNNGMPNDYSYGYDHVGKEHSGPYMDMNQGSFDTEDVYEPMDTPRPDDVVDTYLTIIQ